MSRQDDITALRQAGRWNALVEALREEEQLPGLEPYQRVAILIEMAEVYLQQLHLDAMARGALSRVLELQPHHPRARMLLRQLEPKRGS